MMTGWIRWLAVASMLTTASPLLAQSTSDRVNQGIVGVLAGSIDGTSMHAASDLALALDDGDRLRILPIQGKGSVQAITDLLYLRGVDIAIIQRDALEYSRREQVHPSIEGRIRYVTKLFNEEVHVVARQDIGSIAELAGLPVNIGIPGSGSDLTASLLFDTLGVEVDVRKLDHALALEQLLAGELAAMVYVGGQPTPLFEHLDPRDGLHLLSVDYTPELLDLYLPAGFSAEDYPGLVPPGTRIDTIAVEAIMAAYNWPADHPRYTKVARFVEAFFAGLERLQQPPRHRKWLDVRLDAPFAGWQRFAPAVEQLQQQQVAEADPLKADFERFLGERDIASMPETLKQSLFAEFQRWQGGEGEPAHSYLFALVPKAVNNAFFNVADEGCQEAAADFADIECLYVGPGEHTEQEQAQILQDLIDRGIDGIALSPTNSPLLAGVLRRAKEAGIPVLTWDADLDEEIRDLRATYIGSDNYQIGVQIAEAAKGLMPSGGNICIMTNTKASTNTNRRMDGIRDTLSGVPGTGRLAGDNGWQELADCPMEHQSNVALAMQQLNELLSKQLELDAILSVAATPQRSDADYRRVITPYRDRLDRNELFMVMADTLPMQMEQLRDGLSHIQVGQRPFEMGYRAMTTLKDLAEGRPVLEDPIYTDLDTCTPANVDTCVFGKESIGEASDLARR
jgi:ribose transport system substrate-binding protein